MANAVFVNELMMSVIIIISLLFAYNFYEPPTSNSRICSFFKFIGIVIILIMVSNLMQIVANVLI